MSVRILFFIIGLVITIIGTACLYINRYIQDSIQKGVQTEVCENMLEVQNQALQEQSIHKITLQEYKDNQDAMLNGLKKKYDAISLGDTSNKSKLQGVQDALDVFFANPP